MKKITLDKQLETYNIYIFKLNYITILFLSIASIICSFGLLLNKKDYILASSIIYVIINPIIAISFLLTTNNFSKLQSVIEQGLLILFITLVISFIIGYLTAYFNYITEPTEQMLLRSNLKKKVFSIDFFIAIIAGFGIYYAIMESNIITILGFIIVFTLLPPITNAGLHYGMYFNDNPEMKDNENYLNYANNSIILFIRLILK